MSIFKDLWKVMKDGLNPKSLRGLGELSKVMIKEPINVVSSTARNTNFIDKNAFKDINTGTQILKDSADFALNKHAILDDTKLEAKILHTNIKPVNQIVNTLIIKPTEQLSNVGKVVDLGLDATSIIAKPVALAGEIGGAGTQLVVKDGLKIAEAGENIIGFILNNPIIIAVVGGYILLK